MVCSTANETGRLTHQERDPPAEPFTGAKGVRRASRSWRRKYQPRPVTEGTTETVVGIFPYFNAQHIYLDSKQFLIFHFSHSPVI